jgi:hypothetical protein
MEPEQVITLDFLRNDGHREKTDLDQLTLAQARILAEFALLKGNGRYREVDICMGDGLVETLQNFEPAGASLHRI